MDITFNSPVNNKLTEPHTAKKFRYNNTKMPEKRFEERTIKRKRRKATKQAVKILREFCIEKEIAAVFENLPSCFTGSTVTKC